MDQANKLYVGNFPYNWSETDLEQVFEDFKEHISDIKIVYDRFSGRSKGFAFVTFDDEDAAQQALKLADTKAGDRTLVVSLARPPKAKGSFERGSGFGGGGAGGGGRNAGGRNGGNRSSHGNRRGGRDGDFNGGSHY